MTGMLVITKAGKVMMKVIADSLGAPLSCLNEARFGIVFGSLGAARDSLETAIAYTQSRDVFDRPLSSYQLTQEKLANMTVELGKGMLLAIHLGRRNGALAGVAATELVGELMHIPQK